jgi:hypothetical protein
VFVFVFVFVSWGGSCSEVFISIVLILMTSGSGRWFICVAELFCRIFPKNFLVFCRTFYGGHFVYIFIVPENFSGFSRALYFFRIIASILRRQLADS